MTAGTLTYNETTTTTAPVTLEIETRVIETPDSAAVKLEAWVNLDPTSQPQTNEVTIATALPTSNCYFKVKIEGVVDAEDETFVQEYLTASADTPATIAAKLARKISQHPDVVAVPGTGANSNKIMVKSVLPGTNGAFVLTATCVGITDNSAQAGKITAVNTPGTGTGRVRKVMEAEIVPGASAAGFPVFSIANGRHFNGAAVPVQAGTFGPQSFTHPSSFGTIRAIA